MMRTSDHSGKQPFRIGEPVIYVVTKLGATPGGRAGRVRPQTHGDLCSYTVDKYWRVTGYTAEGDLIVATRTGKQHVLKLTDPKLRRPNWWTRLLHRSRFPPPVASIG